MNIPLYQGQTHGQPNLYQGASPGVDGGGGGDAFPFGSMQPTTTVNQTMGWQSNYTIPYAFVCRRFRNDSDKSLNIGQFAFIRKQAGPVHKGLYTLINIPQLNNLFDRARKSPPYNQADPRKVLNEWTPLGSIQGEVGGDRSDQPQERLLNVIIAGRTRTLNIWGRGACRDATKLYLVLERVPRGKRNPRVKLGGDYEDTDGRTSTELVWQWRPYADFDQDHPAQAVRDTSAPYREELASWMDGSTLYYGHSVLVGRVSSKNYLSNFGGDANTQDARFDIDKMVSLPQLEVFIHVCPTLELGSVA